MMIIKKLLLVTAMTLLATMSIQAEVPELMGDYRGSYMDPPKGSYQDKYPSLVARVVGMSKSTFEVQLLAEFDRRARAYFKKELPLVNGTLKQAGRNWNFEVIEQKIKGSIKVRHQSNIVEIPFQLEKVVRESPTLGRTAPPGAIDLFAGPGLSKWHHHGKPATWKILPGGVVEILQWRLGGKGNLTTKDTFGDCELHLEFKLPYQPNNRNRKRANSGLFLQMGYEVQILDSYGMEGLWDDCGAVYRIAPPKVNMSAPPEQWQTYDITFKAARFDEKGSLISHPLITVYHNGGLIHKDQEIFERTIPVKSNGKKGHLKGPGPLSLQDHGHIIQFRNFWIKPL